MSGRLQPARRWCDLRSAVPVVCVVIVFWAWHGDDDYGKPTRVLASSPRTAALKYASTLLCSVDEIAVEDFDCRRTRWRVVVTEVTS